MDSTRCSSRQNAWDLLGVSIHEFILQVFSNPTKIGDVNHTLLTLIPKVHEPSRPSDFRPIALCNVIYKIVTKILASRMKHFLPYIIGQNQTSFITGRNATDNPIILQEVVHSMNNMTGRKRYMVIKLDLAKAYDRMEWSFIRECLDLLRFPPPHIAELIHACLSSVSMSINWHGCPSEKFFPTRGLRQGDPMSPLLFVIALERLSHCIQDAVLDGAWSPLKFGRGGPSISHLFFADDIVLESEASPVNAHKIMDILDSFAAASGQTVNKQKSCVMFSTNTPPSVAATISQIMGISETANLGRYLGILIISGRKGKTDFSFLVDKIRSKLSGWKASSLSQAGRITLAQSCIMTVPSYVMQCSKIPASICDEVERFCRDFIWGSTPEARHNHLISWDTIFSPKEMGGLGFRSLHMVTAAYLMKLGWYILTKREALWVQVLRFKYGCGNLLVPTMRCGSRVSHLWRGIFQNWHHVEEGISWIINNGQTVRFWQDPWVPDCGILNDHVLHEIPAADWHLLVSAFAIQNDWNWHLLKNMLPGPVCSHIVGIRPPLAGDDDVPVWKYSNYGLFSIKSAYLSLFTKLDRAPPSFPFDIIWKLRTPPRVNAFLW